MTRTALGHQPATTGWPGETELAEARVWRPVTSLASGARRKGCGQAPGHVNG
jgi:hypothetical protein